MLDTLQRVAFDYFIRSANLENGLVADRDRDGSPASIAAVGMALSVYTIGVERGFITRSEARQRTLTTLRFLSGLPQGTQADASGYRGLFYHFLDMQTGRRAWQCELSTIDTALLMAGVLTASVYFGGADEEETEIRGLGDALYKRVDWRWAEHGGETLTLGWKPRRGFLKYRWKGYDESLILHILGLGSPTYPISAQSYHAYTRSFDWRTVENETYLHGSSLFMHQLSHTWVDFRGIRDAFMAERGIDYFENSRRATYAQRAYAMRNPLGFDGYGENAWGISASDGPGPARRTIEGVRRYFYGYQARGVPNGPDDGTLSSWAVAASLPFAPEIVIPALRNLRAAGLHRGGPEGFLITYNSTFTSKRNEVAWIASEAIGINQGPVAMMIENHRSDLIWSLMRRSPPVINGLRASGFKGGWLDETAV
ncbi:MAG: hypothetical protein KDK08_25160 [Rhizobiaceae bacterium]|nr:hypothetical protein [Rhizobiaceae bacterium]